MAAGDDTHYTIDRILDVRKGKKGLEFRVRWAPPWDDPQFDSYEPQSNFTDGCRTLFDAFFKSPEGRERRIELALGTDDNGSDDVPIKKPAKKRAKPPKSAASPSLMSVHSSSDDSVPLINRLLTKKKRGRPPKTDESTQQQQQREEEAMPTAGQHSAGLPLQKPAIKSSSLKTATNAPKPQKRVSFTVPLEAEPALAHGAERRRPESNTLDVSPRASTDMSAAPTAMRSIPVRHSPAASRGGLSQGALPSGFLPRRRTDKESISPQEVRASHGVVTEAPRPVAPLETKKQLPPVTLPTTAAEAIEQMKSLDVRNRQDFLEHITLTFTHSDVAKLVDPVGEFLKTLESWIAEAFSVVGDLDIGFLVASCLLLEVLPARWYKRYRPIQHVLLQNQSFHPLVMNLSARVIKKWQLYKEMSSRFSANSAPPKPAPDVPATDRVRSNSVTSFSQQSTLVVPPSVFVASTPWPRPVAAGCERKSPTGDERVVSRGAAPAVSGNQVAIPRVSVSPAPSLAGVAQTPAVPSDVSASPPVQPQPPVVIDGAERVPDRVGQRADAVVPASVTTQQGETLYEKPSSVPPTEPKPVPPPSSLPESSQAMFDELLANGSLTSSEQLLIPQESIDRCRLIWERVKNRLGGDKPVASTERSPVVSFVPDKESVPPIPTIRGVVFPDESRTLSSQKRKRPADDRADLGPRKVLLRPDSQPPGKKQFPPLGKKPPLTDSQRKKIPCKYFRKGYCERGDRCKFAHVKTSSGS
ncbi:C3H1-type domain-containing protein [Plasmodiophora brassicae]